MCGKDFAPRAAMRAPKTIPIATDLRRAAAAALIRRSLVPRLAVRAAKDDR